MMVKARNIFLIGFMGCGKSTVAVCVQKMYGMKVVEMDRLIAEKQGMSIPQIFETYGEQYFRDLETNLLREIRDGNNQVVSCGGGAVLRETNVAEMKKNGVVILLTAEPETILTRVLENDDRPVLQGKKTIGDISELMEKRRPKYEAAADVLIKTDNKTPQEIVKEIIAVIGEQTC